MDTSLSSIASNCDFNSHQEGVREYLWNEWSQLFGDQQQQSAWFEKLWALQEDDPLRHYHTAVHVQELLCYFHLLRPKLDYQLTLEEQRAVILAIFFHDAVYNATSSTNEDDSTKLFQSFDATNALVDEMILATKAHGDSNDPCIAFFLDLDLSVLGKTASAYQHYARLIRNEYSHVPHATYCEKRAEILESFLQQTFIYKTVVCRELLEEQARSNIAREIDQLRRGVIPGGTDG